VRAGRDRGDAGAGGELAGLGRLRAPASPAGARIAELGERQRFGRPRVGAGKAGVVVVLAGRSSAGRDRRASDRDSHAPR
jgi:hypothetical protein